MSSLNKVTITQSLERSLQNCTLNQNQNAVEGSPEGSSDSPPVAATGEIYYINWTTGTKAKDDPRTAFVYGYSSDDEEDCSSYDSEDSSSESSLSLFRETRIVNNLNEQKGGGETESNINSLNVLVVAGCKSCLMYYMVPKKHEICPKCCGAPAFR